MVNDPLYKESINNRGILTFSCCGKMLYSAYQPEREAANYVATLREATQKETVITLCGADFINKALLRYPEIHNILSFEPVSFPITQEHKKIHHFKTTKELESIIQQLYINTKSIAIITWPPFIETQKEKFLKELEKIRDILIRNTLSEITEKTFSKLEVRHIQKNICRFPQAELLLNEIILGSIPPAVVLSAGASLSRQLDFLRPYLNKVVTFAYPSSLPYLENAEIIPDYTIAVDPGYASFYHLMKFHKPLTLLCPISLSSSIFSLENYQPLLFHYGSQDEDSLFQGVNVLRSIPEGSVAFNLFSILKQTGYQKIILLGQDFCFINGASHVKGGFFETEYLAKATFFSGMEDQIKKLEEARLPAIIKDGNRNLKTDTAMSVYYHHFLEKAEKYPLYLAGNPENFFCGKLPFLDKNFFENLPAVNKIDCRFHTAKILLENKNAKRK